MFTLGTKKEGFRDEWKENMYQTVHTKEGRRITYINDKWEKKKKKKKKKEKKKGNEEERRSDSA